MIRPLRATATALSLVTAMVTAIVPPAAGLTVDGPGDPLRTGYRYRPAVTSSGGAVASANAIASQVGVAVLDGGGNAVDAAVATTFALGVTRPEMCGIGGGGFLVYRGRNGRTAALDFRETAPLTHEHGSGVAEAGLWAYATGHNRAGVPGVVAGLHDAWRRFGRRPWSFLVEPAREIAAEGFPVSPELANHLAVHAQRLRLYPESAETFLIGGQVPYPPGSTLTFPDYAASLAEVRDRGPKAFYRGDIADAIAASMASSGTYEGDRGSMTATDLAEYEAVWRAPLTGNYRGHEVVAMPPPTSGGVVTLQMLELLEGYDLASWGRGSADLIHHLAETQKIAWADRNAFIADPDFERVPAGWMTSPAYADERRTEIDPATAKEAYPAGSPSSAPDDRRGGRDTSHVSVVDADGDAVAVTCSLEAPFGSAVVAPGTGFLLNGQLADFGAPGTANEPEGGKRPRSSMSPTIVVRDGIPVLVTGAAGGSAIPVAVVHQIVGVVDLGLTPAEAIDMERSDARICEQGGPLVVCLDFARISVDVQAELTRRGHVLGYPACAIVLAVGGRPCDPAYHPYAEVQTAGIDAGTGRRYAVSDPRGEWGATGQGASTATVTASR